MKDITELSLKSPGREELKRRLDLYTKNFNKISELLEARDPATLEELRELHIKQIGLALSLSSPQPPEDLQKMFVDIDSEDLKSLYMSINAAGEAMESLHAIMDYQKKLAGLAGGTVH